jgi:hypothetical protein
MAKRKGQEKFENIKRVIGSRKSKDRQCNGQKKKHKKSLKISNEYFEAVNLRKIYKAREKGKQ